MNLDALAGLRLETSQDYDFRDSILYALGVGAALDAATDPAELRHVYEEGLVALPTMAVVLGYPGFFLREERYGVNWTKVLHGEQSVIWHRPLAPQGSVTAETVIEAIIDKGPDKGAVLLSARHIRDAATGEDLATVRQTVMLRGDGGQGGTGGSAPAPHPWPEGRASDASVVRATRGEQALIYRLSGDLNPIHADPAAAARGGFDRPILHGLATYAIAARAACAALDIPAESLRRYDARFSSPVFPGESIQVDVVREGEGRAALQARVVERDVMVLRNGYMEYA